MSVSTPRPEDGASEQSGKRTRRACDSCYRRKIKCDAAFPSCNWCQHHDIPCTFTRTTARRAKKQKSQQFEPLSERIERIERLLAENLQARDESSRPKRLDTGAECSHSPCNAQLTSTVATTTQIHVPTPVESPDSRLPPRQVPQTLRPQFGGLHFAGLRLGDISSVNGIPLFSSEGVRWLQSRTGQEIDFERLCPFAGLPWQSQQPFYLSTNCRDITLPGTSGLPDIDLLRENVSTFGRSSIRLVFPFVDPILFEDTIRLAYQPPTSYQTGHVSAKACVCALMAVAGLFSLHREPAAGSDSYAWKAQSLLPLLSLETTLDGLQTCIMMLVYHLLSGNLQPAVFLNAFTSGFVFMIGAHTRNPELRSQLCPDIPQRMDRQLRNLFWVCYALDKELSLRTGQPPAINDDYCDLSLPNDYGKHLEHQFDTLRVSSESLIEIPLLGDFRLSKIKSRAYSMLYSIGALRKSDADILKAIRELDNELETWRMSLPQKCRPTLSFSKDSQIEGDMDMQAVMLRLEYHHCMAIIHHASGRCVAWNDSHNGIMEGVSSSLALSVEASRSSLAYLQTAQHVLPTDSFWLVLFYPMSAVLTLFCNILLNPLDSLAAGDLDLLSSVPALIRVLPVRQLTVNEIMHIKHLEDFVAELGRLATCAVHRASECCAKGREFAPEPV